MKKKKTDNKLTKDINFLSSRMESSELKGRYKDALEKIGQLQKEVDAINTIKQVSDNYVVIENNKRPSEATAVILTSDWHIEENVDPKTINGLNEFSLTIAEQRVNKLFSNSAKLVRNFQRDIKIDNIVLWLGGDYFSGSIHEELLENTSLRPIEAVMKAQEFIIGGIKHLLAKTNCNLIIPCNVGNHSRMTAKTHISTEQGNSLENYMYHNIANYFRNNKRTTFLISTGYHLYLDIYNYKLRFHHGHQMRYQGGVGGLTIPVNKAIAQWDKGKKVDYTCFGHWHTKLDGGNFISNGCLVGYNAYALSLKASYEEPSQTFFLLDKDYGKTVVAPIFLR